MHTMETIYFDTLQFVYHLALAILVGARSSWRGGGTGDLRVGALPRRGWRDLRSGARRYDGLAILCVFLIVVTSILKATAFEVTGAPETRLIARWIALLILCGATLYSSAWANPVARGIKAQTSGWDDLRDDAPMRREFASLHASSRRAMTVATAAGIVALFLS